MSKNEQDNVWAAGNFFFRNYRKKSVFSRNRDSKWEKDRSSVVLALSFCLFVKIDLPWQHRQFLIYYEQKCWQKRRRDHLTDERGEIYKKLGKYLSKIVMKDFFLVYLHFFRWILSRIFFVTFNDVDDCIFYCRRFTVNVIHRSFFRILLQKYFLLVL